MKSNIFKAVTVINIAALAILAIVWWMNGQNDTWLYVTSGLIVVSSFLYVSRGKK